MPDAAPKSSDLHRFVAAQQPIYAQALHELQQGKKQSHWMWFVFPQLAGLGTSEMARKYALSGLHEATGYLAHPVLGPRLCECCAALLALAGSDARAVMGSPDDMKLRSSTTLFSLVPAAPPVFRQVLEKFFAGEPDPRTLQLLNASAPPPR
jgi:uncharacterized protein (DUF1810 family)